MPLDAPPVPPIPAPPVVGVPSPPVPPIPAPPVVGVPSPPVGAAPGAPPAAATAATGDATAATAASASPSGEEPEGNSTAEACKAEGNEHFKAGRYEQAVSLYTEAIGHDPTNAALFSNRCVLIVVALGCVFCWSRRVVSRSERGSLRSVRGCACGMGVGQWRWGVRMCG